MDLLEHIHKNAQRAGAPLLRGQSDRVGVVQPGEEKAPGRPYRGLSLPNGACKKDGVKFLAGSAAIAQRVMDLK